MKKNLLNGLLLLSVASVGVGTFSSCKDDNGDELSVVESRVNQLENEVIELKKCKEYCEEARKALKAELMALIEQLQNKDNVQDGRLDALEAKVNQAQTDIINITASIETLTNRISELEAFKAKYEVLDPQAVLEFMEIHSLATNETITEIQNNINTLMANYVGKEEFNSLKSTVESLQTTVANLQNELNTKYTELSDKAENGVKAWAWIEENKARLDALETTAKEFEDFKTKHAEEIANLQSQINDLSAKIDNNASLIEALQGDLANLQAMFENLQDRVAANEAAINNLKNDVNKLFGLADRLNKMVTSIINQATTNPVFGYFNIPFNVRSNMLVTYYGSAQTNYTFPSSSSVAEYNGELVLTEGDMAMLQASGNFSDYSFNQGDVLMDTEDGNAGMVFLTINPNNVDFTGMNLPLVNTQDEESGIKLKNLKKSDKVLNFGYTRADNGFYEAQATLSPDKVNDVAIKIEPGLKSAFGDALKNHGKKDFAQLAKLLYLQFSDVVAANGLKAAWTAPDGNGNMKNYAVYSQYDIAATAVAPLSFKFMEGQSIDKELPIFTPISEFEFDKSQFTFDIDVPPFEIGDVEIDFTLGNVEITPAGDIMIQIEVPEVVNGVLTGNNIIKEYNLKDDINKVLDQVEADVNGTIGTWNEEMKNAFKDAITNLTEDIEKQVDDMMNNVMGQIDDNIGNLVDQINQQIHNAVGGYFDKANKVIEKYNKLANKLNKMLKNPNHYLQTLMCYKGTDGDFHQLSNSKAMPSPFKLAGGNGITLYPTSLTAEIVAPSFKKFVAVTNVWNNATGKSAQEGDAEAKQLLITANSQNCMNSPITGKCHAVAFQADKAGYTYEIVYSALDYRGFTSTRKYYISVE